MSRCFFLLFDQLLHIAIQARRRFCECACARLTTRGRHGDKQRRQVLAGTSFVEMSGFLYIAAVIVLAVLALVVPLLANG